MNFLNPGVLGFLVVVPLGVVFLIWRDRIRLQRWQLLGDLALIERLHPPISHRRRIVKSGLWLFAVGALIVALARPTWGTDVSVIETSGVSVVVLLDVSNSMNAEDVLPSRLERAKISLQNLFDQLAGNELGLILFAGNAVLQFPLTTDSQSASVFLRTASSNSITQQGTNIEAGLRLAMDTLAESTTGSKSIVVVTDGENWQGDARAASASAAEQGIIIYSIGYGSVEGNPIPVLDENGNTTDFKTDAAGNMILSRLDETTLQAMAEQTKGQYWHASADGAEITELVAQINQQQDGVIGSRAESQRVERFGLFVALALMALTIEMLLPETRAA